MTRLDLADGLRLLQEAGSQGYFGHEAHLRFAWSVLDVADDVDDAIRLVSLTIRHVSELHGNPMKYHVTVTVFWIHLLAHLREEYPDLKTVEEMLDRYPPARDSQLPRRHWSNLDSYEARTSWVEPDLMPIP